LLPPPFFFVNLYLIRAIVSSSLARNCSIKDFVACFFFFFFFLFFKNTGHKVQNQRRLTVHLILYGFEKKKQCLAMPTIQDCAIFLKEK